MENTRQIIDLEWARKSEGYDMTPERPEGWFKDEEGAFYLETVKQYPGGVLVELGVWLGRSLSYVLPACRELKITVHAVDTWAACPIELFKGNLARLNASDQVRLLQMGSIEAAQQFTDESVDVVMLDTTHVYEDTKQELRAWWPKIKTGGSLIGHDYGQIFGVKRAVDELFDKPDQVRCAVFLITKTSADRKRR